TLYRNRLYLALIWAPARDMEKVASLASRLRSARRKNLELDEKALRDFEGILPTIVQGLNRYEARLLRLYEHNGLIFSEVMEYLNAIGTLSYERLPLVDGPING